jgi:hypothetical protein
MAFAISVAAWSASSAFGLQLKTRIVEMQREAADVSTEDI